MKLTTNQYCTIKWMQKEKSEAVNITDRHKYLPDLTEKQFKATMKQLENKDLVAKESGRINEYTFFVGWYLTETGKSLIL